MVVVLVISGFLLLIVGPTLYSAYTTRNHRYYLKDNYGAGRIPANKVAIVFGAGIRPDGTPTPYLENRIKTAVALHEQQKIEKILMSGDNSTLNHNEPVVMKKYAIKLGVPSDDVVMDFAGFSTYDTCYRAQAIFGLKAATLVTQGYHLPRAMVTCDRLGVKNIGVAAVKQSRDYNASYLMREYLSSDKMTIELLLKPKPPILGKPEPI